GAQPRASGGSARGGPGGSGEARAGPPPARPACAPAAAGPGAGLLRRRAARRRPRDAPAFFLLNEGPCHPGHLTYTAARTHLSKTGRSGLVFMITDTFRE